MANKKKTEWMKKHPIVLSAAGLIVLAAVILLILWVLSGGNGPEVILGNPQTPVEHPIEINPQMQNMADPQTPEEVKTLELDGFTDRNYIEAGELENGLRITRSGSYTGTFVEDGSNSPCTDVLALIVTNESESFVELLKLAVPVGERTAYFDITALPAGQSVLVMEKTAMTYEEGAVYGQPVILLCSIPDKEFSLHTERFSFNAADRVVNLTNLTPFEISGNIAIYYKNVSNGIYIGGITYSKTIETGVAANGIAQFICENYTVAGSEIIFVLYEE